MTDQAWVVYDHDHGPYAISLHRTAEEAARSAAQAGYGRVAGWVFGVEFADAIREWEKRGRTMSIRDDARAAQRRMPEEFWRGMSGEQHFEEGYIAGANRAQATREPSDAEVEAGAEAMREQEPANTPIWDDWVWHRFARAALLAAMEVRRG